MAGEISDAARLSALLGDQEWLLTDGCGGYAMGTRSLLNTRKYHSLLTVALPPPKGRTVLLSHLEEVLEADGHSYALDTAAYVGDIIGADGWEHIESFHRYPTPTWTIRRGGRLIERSIRLGKGHKGLRVKWRLLKGDPISLLIRPLMTSRSHHHLHRAGHREPERVLDDPMMWWRMSRSDPKVILRWSGTVADDQRHTYRDVVLPLERRRGYDHVEDLYAPVRLRFYLSQDNPAWLSASAMGCKREAFAPEEEEPAHEQADTFLFCHSDGHPGILAGFPWFNEWARDTFLSAPGLVMANGRHRSAIKILRSWGRRVSQGLVPNQLSEDTTDPLATNSADAPLLFIRALDQWEQAAQKPPPEDLQDGAHSVLKTWLKGTGHGIFVSPEGRIHAGHPEEALTWMDAIVDGVPVTPRMGTPVELQALFLHALRCASRWARSRDQQDLVEIYDHWEPLVHKVLTSEFIGPTTGRIVDRLDPDGNPVEDELRPNVLLALEHCAQDFPEEAATSTLDAIDDHLLTPLGLRTLQPEHPDYQGRYHGDQMTRDRAYHQGTVWPWLIGPYGAATLAVRGDAQAVKKQLGLALATLLERLEQDGMIAEVFDGDAPHEPGGCPNQAWSVAEVLRVRGMVE